MSTTAASDTHNFLQNILAARRVMSEHCKGVDFMEVNTWLEIGDYDQAINALGRIEYKPDANVIPNPVLVIAAEIRNARRYDTRGV